MPIINKLSGVEGVLEYLKKLIDNKIVDGILIPKLNSAKDNYIQTLVSSSNLLDNCNPFAPVIPVQTGRIAKNLTFTDSGKKLLIIAKPCEIKAIIELTKFKQVNLENCYLFAVDCAGTYEVNDFNEILKNNKDYIDNYPYNYANGKIEPIENYSFRKSCYICDKPAINQEVVDGIFGFYGSSNNEIFIILKDDSPLKDSIENSDLDIQQRQDIIEKVKKEKEKNKTDILNDFRQEYSSLEGLQKIFSKCIRCHNCMVACPICYCKECVFRSPTFDHSADMIVRWSERKGALRMLENTLMFHITRLNHMSSSCVACGLCSSACPNNIDVSTVFISVSENVQKMLNYKAGESFDDPAPVTTFRENELVVEAGTNE